MGETETLKKRKTISYLELLQNNTPNAYRVFWCYGPEKI